MKNKKFIKKMIRTLEAAEKMAVENRDVELLVAISDRWYALMDGISESDQHKLTIGFIDQEKSNDDRKANNKRKS